MISKRKHLSPFLVSLLQFKYICSLTLRNLKRNEWKNISSSLIASLLLVNKNMYLFWCELKVVAGNIYDMSGIAISCSNYNYYSFVVQTSVYWTTGFLGCLSVAFHCIFQWSEQMTSHIHKNVFSCQVPCLTTQLWWNHVSKLLASVKYAYVCCSSGIASKFTMASFCKEPQTFT